MDIRQIYFEAIDQTDSSMNNRDDNDNFNLLLQVERLLLKCATKSNYEKVSEFYGNELNTNGLDCQLKTNNEL